MLSEKLILHFLPKMFKNYEVKEKSLLRITRNADIDTKTIYDEDLDYRDAMENLIRQRKRMNPVRMELSRIYRFGTKERLDWMFETMMKDDEKGKCLTEKGNTIICLWS